MFLVKNEFGSIYECDSEELDLSMVWAVKGGIIEAFRFHEGHFQRYDGSGWVAISKWVTVQEE